MYAVIMTGGKQYKITPGDILEIDKVEKTKGDSLEFDQVLLLADGEKIQIGQPLVEGAKVFARVVEQIKGEKIDIARFKAKARYRKRKGFRSRLTRIKIEKIR